jgi:hypothetical protein
MKLFFLKLDNLSIDRSLVLVRKFKIHENGCIKRGGKFDEGFSHLNKF